MCVVAVVIRIWTLLGIHKVINQNWKTNRKKAVDLPNILANKAAQIVARNFHEIRVPISDSFNFVFVIARKYKTNSDWKKWRVTVDGVRSLYVICLCRVQFYLRITYAIRCHQLWQLKRVCVFVNNVRNIQRNREEIHFVDLCSLHRATFV